MVYFASGLSIIIHVYTLCRLLFVVLLLLWGWFDLLGRAFQNAVSIMATLHSHTKKRLEQSTETTVTMTTLIRPIYIKTVIPLRDFSDTFRQNPMFASE